MKKTFIHMEVGNDNWTPTGKELLSLTRRLVKVLRNTAPDDIAVFATCEGVRINVIEFDPLTYATSGYITPVVSNQSNPQMTPGFVPYTISTTNGQSQ